MTTQSENVALPIQRLAPLRIQFDRLPTRGRPGPAGDVGTAERLREAEGADLLERVDIRQPGFLLLLRGKDLDGTGEESVVDADERPDGGVGPGDFGMKDAGKDV